MLEEAGDARAAGLRRIGAYRPLRLRGKRAERFRWMSDTGRVGPGGALPCTTFARLRGGVSVIRPAPFPGSREAMFRCYPTRSAAMLALADALA